MRELDIGTYDGILGMDWLAQHNPMTCHWQDKWVKFTHDDEEVTLRGVPTKATTTLKAIKPDELRKMIAGNTSGLWPWWTHAGAHRHRDISVPVRRRSLIFWRSSPTCSRHRKGFPHTVSTTMPSL